MYTVRVATFLVIHLSQRWAHNKKKMKKRIVTDRPITTAKTNSLGRLSSPLFRDGDMRLLGVESNSDYSLMSSDRYIIWIVLEPLKYADNIYCWVYKLSAFYSCF